jgi:TfoX/Sxy family transcriptional regulator of competence genes
VQLPKPDPAAARLLEELTPKGRGVTSKKMFGQPAAFVNGNLFLGVFGDRIFLRLSKEDRIEAARTPGFVPFEPMPGRPMKAYFVVPDAVLRDRPRCRTWVARALDFVSGLPPRTAKSKAK